MEEKENLFYRYWAKSARRMQQEDVSEKYEMQECHLLPYHLLDVMAVGTVLLHHDPRLVHEVAVALEIPQEESRQTLRFFLAIHDIGKFSNTFQGLRRDLMKSLGAESSRIHPYGTRHDSLGLLVWETVLLKYVHTRLIKCFGTELDLSDLRYRCRSLIHSVTGHHGIPPAMPNRDVSLAFNTQDQCAARQYLADIMNLVFGEHSPRFFTNRFDDELLDLNLPRISWLLAGFTVLCDWIASNTAYFPMTTERISLNDYFQHRALPQAEHALRDARLIPAVVRPGQSFTTLFKHENPTPLQVFANTISLQDGPMLFILEDMTGAGKTEAALTLAYRLMISQHNDGWYFALPTQATANGIYQRVGKAYRMFYDAEAEPSLVLAHGARRYSRDFLRTLRSGTIVKAPDHYATASTKHAGDLTATASCSAWIADDSRKTFLADSGVGTVDQALISVLPVRFQSMRLYGLSRKVLIVDEIHAYDPYMKRLLEELLAFHSSLGGSAILLSATLPHVMRKDLVNAFLQPTGGTKVMNTQMGYPLATTVSLLNGEVKEQPVGTRDGKKRTLTCSFIHGDEDSVRQRIIAAARNGGCVCWIRNTVADAVRAYDFVSREYDPDLLTLFHARFARCDRRDIEDQVLKQFGKLSTNEVRRGQIVIATQVVEQSLDLDFDVMVSDLAPIELLIQRAGRLHRHDRGDRGRPELIVYAPEFVEDPEKNWYKNVFPRAAFVYPDHAQLWLTMKRLMAHEGIHVLPDDARDLIEAVYGVDAERMMPHALIPSHLETVGNAHAAAGMGGARSLDVMKGYMHAGQTWEDDQEVPTRLGERSTTVVLLIAKGDRIVPWRMKADDDKKDDEDALALSSLNVNARDFMIIGKSDTTPALTELVEEHRAYFRWARPLVLHEQKDGEWYGTSIATDGSEREWVYSQEKGLRRNDCE